MTQTVPSDLIRRLGRNVVMHILILLLILTMAGCSKKQHPTKPLGKKLPTEASDALRNSTTFELISLEPREYNQESGVDTFHKWRILGSVEISDTATRNTLLNALDAGVAEHDGWVAACFQPRHGISVNFEGKQHDFVICFRCSSGEWYADKKEPEVFFLTDSPKPVLDRVLKAASIQLAPSTINLP